MEDDKSNNQSQNTRTIHLLIQQILLCLKTFFKGFFLRKSIGTLQMQIDTQNQLRRSLNTIHLIGIGIGATIGTGIYVLSGHAAAKFAGPSVIISFIIAGIVALLSALSLSEMATMMPSSGSAYTYTYVALGEYPAFIIGWLSTLLYQLGASIVVVRWSHYLVYFIDLVSDFNVTRSLVEAPVAWSQTSEELYLTGQVLNLPAIAITIAITFILLIGIRETAMVNLVLVIIKLIILLIFIFAGCIYVDRKNYYSFFPSNQGSFKKYGFTGMLHASTFVFFAYVGFESITSVAQEAKKPSQSMPLALILSLILTLLIYVGVCTVMVGLVPYEGLNTNYPLLDISKVTPYGLWLLILLSLGAITALTTVAIVVLLAQTRIFYAMACDGLLPKIFTKIVGRTATPWVSIIVTGIICGILSGIFPLDILGEIASIGALITYIFVHVCVIVMRFTHTDVHRSFKVPFGSWLVPVIGIILCAVLLSNTTRGTGIRFGVWMAIGHVIYFGYGCWHSKTRIERQAKSSISVYESMKSNEPSVSNILATTTNPAFEMDEERSERDAD